MAPEGALARAAAMILAAERPLIMIGAAGDRPRLVEALSALCDGPICRFSIPRWARPVTGEPDLYVGTAALSSGTMCTRLSTART